MIPESKGYCKMRSLTVYLRPHTFEVEECGS